MAINPLDTTTTPAASLAQRLIRLEERCADLERSRRGVGSLEGTSEADIISRLPKPGTDGQQIIGTWPGTETKTEAEMFIYSATRAKWFRMPAGEV